MTTNRIDHAAEAQRRLNSAVNFDVLGMEGNLAAAQVHATLALVEQQRLANIIAIMANATRMVAEGTGEPAAYAALYARLNPVIEEGLGL